MNNIYTVVGEGYACNGRKTRAEAIAEAKAHFLYVKAKAEKELAAIADGSVVVAVQRGWHVPTTLEVLT